jgi:hypothetical protein
MDLPFSHDAFLDVFAAYNTALWLAVLLLWVATAAIVFRWIGAQRIGTRALFVLLAVHWAWSGVAYHWLFFRGINPAAALFGLMFVAQAALFAWLAAVSRRDAVLDLSARSLLGWGLVGYGLIYPLLGLGFGLDYPRMPLFAVPCPTTLITAGLLLIVSGVPPRVVNLVPILWAIVASSAAFTLGIHADLALVPAGLLLGLDSVAPSALGPKPALA